ncbi:unnamed protein product [Anisakis simplex]|uniref:ANK_REP_REGION domain-containing protein n=1 Tax=Anisakis simplex TaxID=6269 RepID=A0A158PN29_ANISI|nr:unnamed protein product [Anisakis simplex]
MSSSLRAQVPSATKCNCCPYGFHIDLDFVKFAENVANGSSPEQQQMHKAKPIRRGSNQPSLSSKSNRTVSPNPRNVMSPMESIFSDSLENIVSDFEETFNPTRDYCSDRESATVHFEQISRPNNGYLSDFGPQINRQAPSGINKSQSSSYYQPPYDTHASSPVITNGFHDAIFSSKKPPVPPFSSTTSSSQSYCTALGRTLSEIKAKQREERELDGRRSASTVTTNAYQKHRDVSRPNEFVTRSGYESERSSYEQGKTHYLGSKTPDMSRKKLTMINNYHNDTEPVPHWRRGGHVDSSKMHKSTSQQLNMDGFASVRRKKIDDGYTECEPSKQSPVYTECRQSNHADSPPYGSLPLRRQLDSLRTQIRQVSSSNQQTFNVSSSSSIRASPAVDVAVNLRNNETKMPNNEVPRTVCSVSTSTPPVPPTKPCSDCSMLKQQLLDLSNRLVTAESLNIPRQYSDKSEGTGDRQQRNVSVGTARLETAEKSVGQSRPVTLEFGTITDPLHKVDFAGDTFVIENVNKATGLSKLDAVNANWVRDSSCSPPPVIQHHSIAIGTEPHDSTADYSKLRDASTLTILDVEALLAVQRYQSPKRECVSAECYTEPICTKENGNDAPPYLSTNECATITDHCMLHSTDRCVGNDHSITTSDCASMTTYHDHQNSMHVQTDATPTRSILVGTRTVETFEQGVETDKKTMKDSSTVYEDIQPELPATASTSSQTEAITEICDYLPNTSSICSEAVATQTEFEPEPSEPRVLNDSEIAESLWLMPCRDTTDVAVGNDDDIVSEITNERSNKYSNETAIQSKMIIDSNVDEDDEKVSVIEETLSDPEAIGFGESAEESPTRQRCADTVDEPETRSRALGQARAAIVKKMLIEKSPQSETNFIRGSFTSKSCRVSSNKGDSLQYIADQYKTQDLSSVDRRLLLICHLQNGSSPSIPQTQKGALVEKVILKKEMAPVTSKVPEPIPARIPRPKIAKYNPGEAQAQSPDEEAEVADRLTPLRSEMRTLRTFTNGRMVVRNAAAQSPPSINNHNASYDNPAVEDDSSTCSSDSEGSYDTNEANSSNTPPPFELSEPLKEALDALQKDCDNSGSVERTTVEWAMKFLQHEWLKTAARRTACASQVEGFIEALEPYSSKLLALVVNMTDQNENTALHYAVSHGNFDVVSVLLDTTVCYLDQPNKAGYTPVMLAALCEVNDEMESAVIHRLFQLGNVNAKAAQHGQTALMLAVSHGKMNTTKLLLQCNADLNIQDEEGSTALMCAAEHGHKDIVKFLLAQPNIDASLSDCDSSTALSIAVENGHRDIGVLIYAHLNYGRAEQSLSQQNGGPSSSFSLK